MPRETVGATTFREVTDEWFRAWAPGRVNLIGEHTDYTGGLVFPMAIDLGIEIMGRRSDAIDLVSDDEIEALHLELPITDPAETQPHWGRYVAGVATVFAATQGFSGRVRSTLPPGAGLSSSAALELCSARALEVAGSPVEIAVKCRDAEEMATGVPCGIMDQLASAAGIEGHALLIDCHDVSVTAIPVHPTVGITVIHSGQPRRLAESAYARRRSECGAAEASIGPLRTAGAGDAERIFDPTVRKRARHVVSENQRVREFAHALVNDNLITAGRLMNESHASLRDDFEVSTDVLDRLVARLMDTPGVFGARLTGAGFGGCVVALHDPLITLDGWRVSASGGAHRSDIDGPPHDR